MAMARRVEPEWLDELPRGDPRARRSRHDLRRVNALMNNASLVAGALRPFAARLRRVAEIGAGDGAFALRVARALPRPEAPREIVLLDRQPVEDAAVARGFAERGWQPRWSGADVFDWLRSPRAEGFDAIVANLFLHHFEDDALARLLGGVAGRAPLFVACEPHRSGFSLLGSRLLGLVGCNDVTRHDAVTSVRAGFDGLEVSVAWPQGAPHVLREARAGWFSHLFVASTP
jgi:hypothetical protein